jgi:hypothetical protein
MLISFLTCYWSTDWVYSWDGQAHRLISLAIPGALIKYSCKTAPSSSPSQCTSFTRSVRANTNDRSQGFTECDWPGMTTCKYCYGTKRRENGRRRRYHCRNRDVSCINFCKQLRVRIEVERIVTIFELLQCPDAGHLACPGCASPWIPSVDGWFLPVSYLRNLSRQVETWLYPLPTRLNKFPLLRSSQKCSNPSNLRLFVK